jgi:transcription elongation factor GreA
LLADGPVGWDRPVPTRDPGVYVIELPAALEVAPIELTRVGKWLERLPELQLDGAHPTSKALAARLAAYWLPDQVVLYIGSSTGSIGGRVAALRSTVLGDRRPFAGGHWLHTLRPDALARARVWWASTDAPEEYEDALLSGFGEAVPAETAAASPEPGLVLPWAVLRRPTGERRAHGIVGSLLPEPAKPAAGPPTVRTVPEVPPEPARPPVGGIRPSRPRPPSTGGRRRSPAVTSKRAHEPVELSPEGLQRLQDELGDLRARQRPAAVRRVASARELGDLKENAEYHAAREELGFIDGRISALEARLRAAVVVEAATGSSVATIGSTVRVEADGEEVVYRLVGSTEADPTAGRLSTSSPVGRALLGHGAGDEVAVRLPSGADVHYRIVDIE